MRVIFELDDGTRLIHEVGGVSPSPHGQQATSGSGTSVALDGQNAGPAPTFRVAWPATAPPGPATSDAKNAGSAPTFLAQTPPVGQTAPEARAETAGAVNAGAAPSNLGH